MPKPHTVECPKCKRPWTGFFDDPLPDKAVCRGCIKNGEGTVDGHRDRVLNPTGENIGSRETSYSDRGGEQSSRK